MKRIALLVSLVFLVQGVTGQDGTVDSLKRAFESSTNQEERTKISLLLSGRILRDNPLVALEYANQSLQLAQQAGNDSLLDWAYLNQANAYMMLGNYPRSLQYYQQSIAGSEKRLDSAMLCVGYSNTGNIYYFRQDYENALTYYMLALNSFVKAGSHSDKVIVLRKANILNNVGIIHEETKRFDQAKKFYDQAYDLAIAHGDAETLANILNNMGTLYLDQGVKDSAFHYYTKAMELRIASNNKFGIARSYNNLGEFYTRHTDQVDKAEAFLNQSVALSKEIGALQTLSSSEYLLYELHKKTGNYKEALKALEANMKTADSLFNEENTRKLAQLELQFEFDKKQSEQEAQQKERDLYYLLGASLLLLLLLIVSLLYVLQKSKTRKSQVKEAHLQLEKVKLTNDLAVKDKELATNIMFLLNKNELINTISEKLLDIKTMMPEEKQGSIQRVVLDMQSNLQPELWQEFEFRFQQVHEQFYHSLNEKFPDLTPSERRLCAFLKLNMTTKEISALTHQNAKSIDVARTRLRKKLNLTGTDQNLVTFLEQLGQ